MPLLLSNRSMPDSAVIPVLHYPEVPQAVAWLGRAFGFSERLRIAHPPRAVAGERFRGLKSINKIVA